MNIDNRNLISSENHFYQMLSHLLETNEIVLFGRIDQLADSHVSPGINLLQRIYISESVGYPFEAPEFNEKAAIWSSKILFYTAQLVMYREHDQSTLSDIITPFEYDITDSAILTADLSLRFVPSLLQCLQDMDVDDELIPMLKQLLCKWHYSGLLSNIDLEGIQFSASYDNSCLRQLYVDRVIKQKQSKVAQLSNIRPSVKSVLGNYEQSFWKDFNSVL